MVEQFTTNVEENVGAKTENWSSVVAFEKSLHT